MSPEQVRAILEFFRLLNSPLPNKIISITTEQRASKT